MTATRLTVGRLAQIRESMSQRDGEVLSTLGNIGVATARQLERLHFYSGTTLSNARVCRRTLERLTQWRVIGRMTRRIGGARAGSAGFCYAIDVAGRKILDEHIATRRKAWTPSIHFLSHSLAVSELYVRLVEAARTGRFEVLRFEAEPGCWRHFTGMGGETIVLRPDAFVRLQTRDFDEHAFVEVDLATESGRALTAKMDRYQAYWVSGKEQNRFGVFPRVLWLVPTQARYKQLVEVASRQPPDSWRLFQVAEFDHAIGTLGGSDG